MAIVFARAFCCVVLTVLSLAASGAAAAEFWANTFTLGNQGAPAVARIGDGFVVVWVSAGQDGSGFGVYGQRYAASGARAGAEFRVNTTTAGDQRQPAVAGLSGGGFIVVWAS